MDGICGTTTTEYTDAATVSFLSLNTYPVQVYAKHDANYLYFCLSGLVYPAADQRNGPNAVVYLDALGYGGVSPSADHYAFHISYNGLGQAFRGSRDGFSGPFQHTYFIVRHVFTEPDVWSAEFRISRASLGWGDWNRSIRLAFAQQWVNYSGDDYGWPANYLWNQPDTWAPATLTQSGNSGSVNFYTLGMEVTQGIQGPGLLNTVPLIRNKRTFVRLHFAATEVRSGVSARLQGYSGANLLGTLTPLNPGGAVVALPRPRRELLHDSLFFELPLWWTTIADLRLVGDVNPLRNPSETTYADNLSTVMPVFVATDPLRLVLFDVQYPRNNNRVMLAPTHILHLESWLRRAYPISDLVTVRRPLYVGDPNSPLVRDIGNAAGYVNGVIDRARRTNFADQWLAVGLVDESGGFMRGLAPWMPAWTTASPAGFAPYYPGNGEPAWDSDSSWADWYGGHEIGHALGRPHVGRFGGGRIGCDADWWFFMEPYPYEDGSIGGPLRSFNKYYGFDPGDPALSIQPQVIPPTWKDVMGYCSYQWVSDHTYNRLRQAINDLFPAPFAAGAQAQANTSAYQVAVEGDFLYVYAEIDLNQQTATLPLVSRETGATQPSSESKGDYSLRLLDASQDILAQYPFTPLTDTERTGYGYYLALLNYHPKTARISIYSPVVNAEIGGVSVSPNPPQVNSLQVQVNEKDNLLSADWQGFDADSDKLLYDIAYSSNNGQTWVPLAVALPETQFSLSLAEIPGTFGQPSGVLRVTANDGVQTGFAEAGQLTLPDHAPQVFITSPDPANAKFEIGYGQALPLTGYAYDLEDGLLLDGQTMFWQSSIDGWLGTGPIVSAELLSVGQHTITLFALDTSALSGQTSIQVTVLPELDDLQPAPGSLEFGPLDIQLFASQNGGPAATQWLGIRDLSGHATTWSAALAGDTAWVVLSGLSGSAPADLGVSANAQGLPAGVYTASLTITWQLPNQSAPEQQQTIPLILRVGPSPAYWVFMPLNYRR